MRKGPLVPVNESVDYFCIVFMIPIDTNSSNSESYFKCVTSIDEIYS